MFLDRMAAPQYTDDELAQRAAQAKRLLTDPFFLSVMEEAENGAISVWLQNTDAAARERCWLMCKGLDVVMTTLRAIQDSAPQEQR